MIVFAAIIPYPAQIVLSEAVGSLFAKLKAAKPDIVIITAPDPQSSQIGRLLSKVKNEFLKLEKLTTGIWAKPTTLKTDGQQTKLQKPKVATYYTDYQSPLWHFQLGHQIVQDLPSETRIAWLATGLLSNRLETSPFGTDPSAGEYDHKLIQLLTENRIEEIIMLEPDLTEAAGENGLCSFAMLLGALAGYSYDTKIISYENHDGFGHLTTEFQNLTPS